jgi:hypothetical protein
MFLLFKKDANMGRTIEINLSIKVSSDLTPQQKVSAGKLHGM